MKEVTVDQDCYRLIPSRFPAVSVYGGLVEEDQFDRLFEIENKTNPRLQSLERHKNMYATEGSPQLQNWNHAPFKYLNPEGSMFFPMNKPALDLAWDAQTALARAVARRELFLSRTKEGPTGIDMRMLKTPVKGKFADLTGFPIDSSSEERWAATTNIDEKFDGVLFAPPERPTSSCVAVTNNGALGRSVQTVHYRFEWNGSRIARLYAFTDSGDEIDPELLKHEEALVVT